MTGRLEVRRGEYQRWKREEESHAASGDQDWLKAWLKASAPPAPAEQGAT